MTVLESFGFKIFRLKEVKESDEFLIYDIEKKIYNQYSEKRLFKILDFELYSKGIDYREIAIKKLSYGESCKNIQLLKEWVYRECKLLDNFGYFPQDTLIFKEENKVYFNMYNISPLLKKKTMKGKFDNIKELILNLVGDNKEEYNYFISWIGWQIQNPLNRLPTSIILQGEHGTGKTKFCELILKNIFGQNFCEIGQTDINKEYNDFIVGKQLIVANEVIHNDNKLLIPDKLKNYVTDEFLSINRKFKDTIYVKNFSQWIFISNNDMPLKIEKGDRRYTVFKSKKLKDGFTLISNLLKNLEDELISFLHELKTIKIDYNYVATPLMNDAKLDLLKLSQNSVEEFISYIKELGGLDLFGEQYKYPNGVITNCSKGSCVITEIFYELYCQYCFKSGINHKFTRRNFTIQLKKLGLRDEVANIDSKAKRVILLEGIN